jgi:putative transposase
VRDARADEEDREVERAMRKSRFSEEQIIGILRLAEAGQSVAEVCRQQGISEGTYYRWKAQYGGLEVSQLRRLRQLEEDNRRLKQIVADLTLDNTALKELTTQNG